MNRAGFPDGVNQAVHDREMAETDGDGRIAAMRRDQAVDQYAIAATTHPQSASALMDDARLYLADDEHGFLRDVLSAVILSRVEASCLTDGDRLAALQARIERAVRTVCDMVTP